MSERQHCVCKEHPEMELLMESEQGKILVCPSCARLIYRSEVDDVERHYIPVPYLVRRLCPVSGALEWHLRRLDGQFDCLHCRAIGQEEISQNAL